ncbi:uncharacterized protein LOC116110228 [Pistacia vera]|uniref:uncharacterized protein LOC116110228 n=1 Tax=Pistacia vera TaxID=55513 RepID=UPI001263A05D|nr:uncharacterized protein LOC116110228 [Pistacia vera]
MVKVAVWNVRGLNSLIKQKEVRNLISSNNLSLCAVLETRVRENNMDVVRKIVFRNWAMVENYCFCERGRIWVGWVGDILHVQATQTSAQAILWEKKRGSNKWNSQCEEFNDMCKEADIGDLNTIGSFFTWNNRGEHWSSRFPNSFASFLTPGISDHFLMVVDSGLNFQGKKSPFEFFNFWAEHEDFLPIVERVWSVEVEGNPMYRLVSKLKALKVELKRLNRKEFWNISERVKFARDDLAQVQERLVVDPVDGALLQEEKLKVEKMVKLSKAEESLAKQKSG